MNQPTAASALFGQITPLLGKQRLVAPILKQLHPGNLPGLFLWELLWSELLTREGPQAIRQLAKELRSPTLQRWARTNYLESYAAAFAAVYACWQLQQKEPRTVQVWVASTPQTELIVEAFARALRRWLDGGGAQYFTDVPSPADLMDATKTKAFVKSLEKSVLLAVDDDVGWTRADRTAIQSEAAGAFTPRRKTASIAASVRKVRKERATLGLPQAIIVRSQQNLVSKHVRKTAWFNALKSLHPPLVSPARAVLETATAANAKPDPAPTLKELARTVTKPDLDALVPQEVHNVIAGLVPPPGAKAAKTRSVVLGVCLGLHFYTPWDSSEFAKLGLPTGKTVLETIRRWQDAGVWEAVTTTLVSAGIRLDLERIEVRAVKRRRHR